MSEREKIYQEAMQAGHSAAWDLKWEKAAEFYRKALAAKPNDYQALISLGLALYELGENEKALQMYARAAKISPREPAPWEKIGQIYERFGKPSLAAKAYLQAAERFMGQREIKRGIENYNRVLLLEPDNLSAHSRLALIYDRLKQVDRAAEEYIAIAALLQRSGKVERAIKAVKRAVELLPNDPHIRRALIAVQRGTLLPKPEPPAEHKPREIPKTQSKALFQTEAPEENQQTPIEEAVQKAISTLAEVLFERAEEEGKAETSKPALASLMRGLTSPTAQRAQQSRVLLLIGKVVDLQTQGEYSQAAEELKRAVAAGLDHAAAYFDLGFLLLQSGKPHAAISYLRRSALNPDYSFASQLLLSKAYQQAGDKVEAARHALEALKVAEIATLPANQADEISQLYEPIIDSLTDKSDEQTLEAIIANIASMLEHPTWEENLVLARQQIQESNGEEGLMPVAEMLLETDSEAILGALRRVRSLLNEGKQESALEEAELALIKTPYYLPLHTLIADILVKDGLLEAAEEKYLAVARTYRVRGNAERAVALYRRVLEINPMNLKAHAQLVETLTHQGHLEEAIAHSLDLAEGYYRLADLENAEEVYREALQLAKRLPEAQKAPQKQILLRLADIAEQRLDWRQAAEFYKQLRTLEPENESIRAKLIEFYLRTEQTQKALSELDDYIAYMQQRGKGEELLSWLNELAKAYNIAEVHLRLGRVYADAGEHEKAIAAYDTAGEILLDNDRLEEAAEAIEAILALNPQNADEYRQALAQLKRAREG